MTKINKEAFIAWLMTAPSEIEIEEIGDWLKWKSEGKYKLKVNNVL